MYKIIVNHFFEAGHQLADTPDLVTKACNNFHGHTYYVEVTVISSTLLDNGMVIDFKKIKNIINEFDHTFILQKDNPLIDEIQKLTDQIVIQLNDDPTAENIAMAIKHSIENAVKGTIVSIKLAEGYKGRDNSSFVEV